MKKQHSIETDVPLKDLSYLSYIFDKLNDMLLKLQSNYPSLIKKVRVMEFNRPFVLFKNSIEPSELYHFTCLQHLGEDMLTDADLEICCCYLETIRDDMMIRFKYLQHLNISE